MNPIEIIDDFLSTEEQRHIHRYFEKNVAWYFGSQSDREAMPFGHWNFDFLQSDPRNEIDLESQLGLEPKFKLIANLWQRIKTELRPGHRLVRCYANAHTFGVEGYPHVDSRKPGHCTTLVYVNPLWAPEWAGETVFFNEAGDIIQSALPRPGRLALFDGRIIHAARAVTRRCPALRVSLIFKSQGEVAEKTSVDPEHKAFLLANGADEVEHSGYTLMDHLEGVHRILTLAKCPEHVCAAGLYHSAYGTKVMHVVTIDHARRDEVKSRIGEPAERLAWAFCNLERPSLLESALATNELSFLKGWCPDNERDVFFKELVQIEIANLIEQKSLYRYPNLARFAVREKFLDAHGLCL